MCVRVFVCVRVHNVCLHMCVFACVKVHERVCKSRLKPHTSRNTCHGFFLPHNVSFSLDEKGYIWTYILIREIYNYVL